MKMITSRTSKTAERRSKSRFAINREMRYKVLKDGVIVQSGSGQTLNMSSGGVAFLIDRNLDVQTYIELSISWPVLLDDDCPMRLIVFGRVLRSADGRCACTMDKYEFRTQSRTFQPAAVRNDSMLRRWAEEVQKETLKSRAPSQSEAMLVAR